MRPQADATISRDTPSWTSARSTRCWACPTARWRPTAAACTRARASAWPARARPIVEYFKLLADDGTPEAHARADQGCSTGLDVGWDGRGGACGALADRRRSAASTPTAPAASIPALARHRRRAGRRGRRRLAGAEEARGARPHAGLRGAVRRGDGVRLRVAPGGDDRRRRPPPSIARRRRGDAGCGAVSAVVGASNRRQGAGQPPKAVQRRRAFETSARSTSRWTSHATTPYWLDAPPEAGPLPVTDRRADRRARGPAAAARRARPSPSRGAT